MMMQSTDGLIADRRANKKYVRILVVIVVVLVFLSISSIVLFRYRFLFPVDLLSEELPPYLLVYPEPGQEVLLSNGPEEVVLVDLRGNWYIIPDWEPGEVCVILSPIDILESGDFWNTISIQKATSLIVNNGQATMVSIVDEETFEKDLFRDDVLVAETGGPYRICWKASKQLGYVRAQFQFKKFSYRWWYRNVK